MSAFPWLCVNVMNTSYTNIRPAAWKGFTTPDGKRSAKVGIYGITLDSNNRTYQSYDTFENSIPKAQSIVQSLRTDTGADVVIGLTHLPYWHDQTMSSTIDAGDVIMGGHEHIRIAIPPANGLPGIYKADSNVHSAWVHDIYVDPTLPKTDPNHLVITSVLVDVDQSLTADPTLSAQVQSWVDLAFEGFTEAGFAPAAYLATPTEDLVGTNDVIFSNATTLTKLFNLACVEECLKYGTDTFTVPPIDGTLFNAGAIRIDDTIPAQTSMIQYDAIRISPYLNAVMLVKMTGAILKQALDTSESKLGNSQHLHTYPNITVDASSPSGYTVNGSPLDPSVDRWYVMGVLKFLMRGKAPYAFLVSGPQVVILAGDFAGDDPHADVRKSLIDQIALAYNPPGGNGDDDGPARVLGLRIPVFILVLVAGLVILACMVYGCLRHRRNRGPKRGEWESSTDQRAFLQSQYHVQNSDAMYETDP